MSILTDRDNLSLLYDRILHLLARPSNVRGERWTKEAKRESLSHVIVNLTHQRPSFVKSMASDGP